MVKQVFGYILIFAVLLNNNTVTELLKTPFLVKHYIEHHHKNSSIGIARFISMHYMGNDIKNHDDVKDMKLPFKKIESHAHYLLFKSTSRAYSLLSRSYKYVPQPILQVNFFEDSYIDKLYRPPQA